MSAEELPVDQKEIQSSVIDRDDAATDTGSLNTSKQVKRSESIVSNNTLFLLPLMSYKDGIPNNKASFGLHTFNHVICTLDGRDKFTKLLQYTCRLIVWYLTSISSSQSSSSTLSSASTIHQSKSILNKVIILLRRFFIAERFSNLQKSISSSRKVYRIGRSFIELQKIQSLGLLDWIKTNVECRCSTTATAASLADTKLQLRKREEPLWYVGGNAIKSLGLLFFWLADNVSFLIQSGFFDQYNHTDRERINHRNKYMTMSTNVANRSYFIGAIAGLITNYMLYTTYTKTTLQDALLLQLHDDKKQAIIGNDDDNDESRLTNRNDILAIIQKAKMKQLTLHMALVKSMCDVLVFSNNPGVDLWRTYTKRFLNSQHPMPEVVHCFCGIMSACIVLYNNYPSISDME